MTIFFLKGRLRRLLALLISRLICLAMHSLVKRAHFRPPSPETYINLIERFSRTRSLSGAKALHACLVVAGLARLTHFASKLISFYSGCKQMPPARKVFDEIPFKNKRSWAVLIGGYSRNGHYKEAVSVFGEMLGRGLGPDVFVIPSVLKSCGHLIDIRLGRVLHCVVLKGDSERDVVVASSLIDMYCKCKEVVSGMRVFDRIVEKDLVAWNSMVSGCVQCGLVGQGLDLVEEMSVSGAAKPDMVTWNTLIYGFAKVGDETTVSRVFELMRLNGEEPDVVSWTSVISGLVQNFHSTKAFDVFRKMLRQGLLPTSNTISCLLPACATVANVRRGKELHGYAVVAGAGGDLYVSSALLDMYTKCGYIYEARMLFSWMPERSTVTWNSMIFGYANHGYCNEAIGLFHQMEAEDCEKIDHLTFTAALSALSACSHIGMVDLAKSLLTSMQDKYKIVPRLEHYACLVDLLGKAGRTAEAYSLIQGMPMEPDLFIWGALLGSCRIHGDVDLAEIAARHLAKLEPGNAGNNMLLKRLYVDAGRRVDATMFKKRAKGKKLNRFSGCSWVEAS